jgi:hypothetical protein
MSEASLSLPAFRPWVLATSLLSSISSPSGHCTSSQPSINKDQEVEIPISVDGSNSNWPLSLSQVIADGSLKINNAFWFRLLQDDGEEMTLAKAEIYGNHGGSKAKKKTRRITYGACFFGDLYSLSATLYDMRSKNHNNIFHHVLKVHCIGHWIAERRVEYDCTDMHSIGSEGVQFMDFINSPDYIDWPHYYILTQSLTIKFLFNQYGMKGEEK